MAKASTVRRLYREQGLDRVPQKLAAQAGERGRVRLRWEAEAPGLLWHSDVCHGLRTSIGGQAPQTVHLHEQFRHRLEVNASKLADANCSWGGYCR